VHFIRYILKRLVYAAIILFFILSFNFLIFRVMPGNPVGTLQSPNMTPEMKQLVAEQYGLDKPLKDQYFIYIKNLLKFEFGYSFQTRRPVKDEILERLPNTLLLLGTSTLLSMILGILMGIFAAARRGSVAEHLTIGSGLLAYSVPTFFLQLLLLLAFAFFWPIFPIRGTMSIPPPTGFFPLLVDRLHHLALPALSLTIIGAGSWALYTRNAMSDALCQDYILTAKAKGLAPRRILYHHAFRSILPPIVTLFFLSLPGIIGGAVVTESIFSWPGVGRYLLSATLEANYPAAQGAFYLIALATLISNLVADLAYGLVDPRIRVGQGGH
jgi:peptide/nickel transport system permease protein